MPGASVLAPAGYARQLAVRFAHLLLLPVLATSGLVASVQNPARLDGLIGRARARVDDCERRLGPGHADTATAHLDLGRYLFEAQQTVEATRAFARALRIREKLAPEGDAAVGEALQCLAAVQLHRGDLEQAAALFERALALRQRWLGEGHAEVGATLLSLGQLHRRRGQLETAERLSRRALEVLMAVPGGEHPLVGTARQTLAGVLVDLGRLEEARHELELALLRGEAQHGKISLLAASLHQSLSQVLAMQALVPLASQHAERALHIRERLLGPEAAETMMARAALGNVLGQAERWADAVAQFRLVLSALERQPEPVAGLHLHVLSNLAITLRWLGDRDEAALLARQVVERCQDGAAPPQEIATALGKAGAVLLEVGDPQEAERLVELAIERVGDRPGDRLRWSLTLAVVKIRNGETAVATLLLRRSLEDAQALLAAGAPVFTERTRLLWTESARQALEALLALTDAAAAAEVHALIADWKNQVARGLYERRQWLRRHASPEALSVLDRLASAHAKASTWRPDAAEQARLDRERERLELDLSRLVPAEQGRAPQPPRLEGLVGNGEALVDYVVWSRDALRDTGETRPPVLSAFVVAGGRTTRVDLGELAPIVEALAAHRLVTARRVRPFASAAARHHAEQVSRRLRALVWDPLRAAIGAANRVIVCPDGPIALLPFETLPGEADGSFLVESVGLRYLQSPLELAEPAVPAAVPARVLLVGDVDYRGVELGRSLPALPGTAAEVEGLARLAGVTGAAVASMVRGSATEGRVRRAALGSSFVHLATHGFADEAAAGGLRQDPRDAMLELFSARLDDPRRPGARSGIVLARGAGGAEDDGILTADDLCWLDLSACELCTLSACETGLGRAMAGEHLLGLRRALRLAGAKATLTTLWGVPDAATQELMVEVYRRIWQDGASNPAALRGAQLARIARNRARCGDALPGTWGGFVLEGR